MSGDMPAGLGMPGWAVARLGDISDFITKGTTPTTLGFAWTKSGIPFLRSECVGGDGRFKYEGAEHISDEAHRALERSTVRGGDILVAITGYVGKVCVYPFSLPEGNINQHIARVRIQDTARAIPEFIYHVLTTREYRRYFERIVTGQAYPQVSLKQVRDTPIPLPSLAEQRRIAAVLSALDNVIEAAQRVVAQVARLKGSLLDRYFSKENAEQKGWCTAELADLIQDDRPICYGILMPGRGHLGGVPVVKVRNMKNGAIDEKDLLLTSPEIDQQYARSRLRAGDLLLSIRGTTGRVARVPVSLDGANITQDSARLSIRPDVLADYIYHCLHSPYLQQQVADHTRGQAVKGINIADVRRLLVPLPAPHIQRELAALFNAVDVRLAAERESVAATILLKAALQTKLLDGTLRVSLGKAA